MGRPGLPLDWKFRRLARALDGLQAGFGAILARGALEQLWDTAYEAGDDYLGDADDVEAAAGWNGRTGMLTDALASAGGEGRAGFIEEGGSQWWPEGNPDTYRVHDLYDHAPEYVRKRMDREAAREARGETLTEIRAQAARVRWDKHHRAMQVAAPVMQTDAACTPSADACNANGTAPTPTPTPTPEAAASDAPAHVRLGGGGIPSPAAADELRASPAPAVRAAPRVRAAPVAVDEPPPRPLEVVDESHPWQSEDPFPLVGRFRDALAMRLARTARHPVGGQGRDLDVLKACQGALAVIGEDEAVRLCAQRVQDAVARREPQPRTLKFFVDCVLCDELTRRASRPKGPRRCTGMDDNGQPIWAEAT